MDTIRANDGITYHVVGERSFTHNGKQRTEFVVRRPRGRVLFCIVRYENGAFGDPARSPA